MRKGEIKTTRLFTKNIDNTKTFNQLVDEFLKVVKVLGRSEFTIKSYSYHAKYFIQFIGDDFLCKNINKELFEDYIRYMQKEKHITNGVTLNSYIRNITPIIKYGYKQKYILEDFQMPVVLEQETFKEIYTPEELNLLLEKPKKNDFVSIRTWSIIWVLASTGIRSRELRELKVGSVDFTNRVIAVNNTKNKKARYIPISESLGLVLNEYLSLRGGKGDDYLFCTVFDEILSPTCLSKSITKYCNSRGVEKSSIHLFRHTFITNAVNKNVNPLILKKITGHSTLKELNKYYNAKTTDIVEVIDDIAPKGKRKHQFKK